LGYSQHTALAESPSSPNKNAPGLNDRGHWEKMERETGLASAVQPCRTARWMKGQRSWPLTRGPQLGKPTQGQEATRSYAQCLAGRSTEQQRAASATAPGSKRLRIPRVEDTGTGVPDSPLTPFRDPHPLAQSGSLCRLRGQRTRPPCGTSSKHPCAPPMLIC